MSKAGDPGSAKLILAVACITIFIGLKFSVEPLHTFAFMHVHLAPTIQ